MLFSGGERQDVAALTGSIDQGGANGMAPIWTILADFAAIITAWKAGDMAGVSVAVMKLLHDLGVTIPPREFKALIDNLTNTVNTVLRAGEKMDA